MKSFLKLFILLVIILLGVIIFVNAKTKDEEYMEIVCIGDSLTEGYPTNYPYTYYLNELLNDNKQINIINKGKVAVTTDDLVENYKSFVSKTTDKVVLLIGINDIIYNDENSLNYEKNIEDMVKVLVGLKLEVILCTYPKFELEDYYYWTQEEFDYFKNESSNLNSVIKDISEKYNTKLVDLEKEFDDYYKTGQYTYSELSIDGVHFNKNGYNLMAKFIYKEL